ncbi:hypothetical protein GOODEAATRI_026915, partial [Goodea atripinnis]
GLGDSSTHSVNMALLTPLFAFLYHLPQVYKWLLKPYYVASLFMSVAFLTVRKTPGICDHLASQREDGNSCDFDWVCIPAGAKRGVSEPTDHSADRWNRDSSDRPNTG